MKVLRPTLVGSLYLSVYLLASALLYVLTGGQGTVLSILAIGLFFTTVLVLVDAVMVRRRVTKSDPAVVPMDEPFESESEIEEPSIDREPFEGGEPRVEEEAQDSEPA